MMLKVKIKEFVKQIQNIGFVNNLEQLAQPVLYIPTVCLPNITVPFIYKGIT